MLRTARFVLAGFLDPRTSGKHTAQPAVSQLEIVSGRAARNFCFPESVKATTTDKGADGPSRACIRTSGTTMPGSTSSTMRSIATPFVSSCSTALTIGFPAGAMFPNNLDHPSRSIVRREARFTDAISLRTPAIRSSANVLTSL
jgi:hypothetical protein